MYRYYVFLQMGRDQIFSKETHYRRDFLLYN